jgi:hypothetical protein
MQLSNAYTLHRVYSVEVAILAYGTGKEYYIIRTEGKATCHLPPGRLQIRRIP